MQKLLASILAVVLIFSVAVGVSAQTEDELPNPGITPNNPLYFIKTLSEDISLFFAFSPEAKTRRATAISNTKAAEIKAMAEAGNTEAAERATERYGRMIERAAQNLALAAATQEEDFDEALAELVTRATSIHTEVLAEVFERVPEQARPAIERAIEESSRGTREAIRALEERSSPRLDMIREETETRLERVRQNERIPQNVRQMIRQDTAPENIPAPGINRSPTQQDQRGTSSETSTRGSTNTGGSESGRPANAGPPAGVGR